MWVIQVLSYKSFNLRPALEAQVTGHRSTQITGQHRSLQVNYVISTKTDIGFTPWWIKMRGTHRNISSSATKLGRIVTCDEKNSRMIPHELLSTWSYEVIQQIKNLVFLIAPGLWPTNRAVTYDEGNSAIMSYDPLTRSSREIVWHFGSFISLLLQGLWSPNFAGWLLLIRETHP